MTEPIIRLSDLPESALDAYEMETEVPSVKTHPQWALK